MMENQRLVHTVQREYPKKHTRETLHLFCYGTLLRGYTNHDRFCREAVSIESATVCGWLYEFLSGIPIMEVPSASILAEGTDSPIDDVETQIQARQSADAVHAATSEESWGMVQGEVVRLPNPEYALPPIDRLEGFVPGERSIYRHRR